MDERKKITKLLKKNAVFLDYSKNNLKDTKVALNDYISSNQIKINNSAIEELLYLTNDSLTNAINELKKLELYKQDEEITKDDVVELVPKKLEHVIFDLVDYLLKNKKAEAIELYRNLLLEGQDSIKVNYILIMQFRLMIQIKMLQKRNYSVNDIASAMKVHPYRVKRTSAQMGNIPLSKLTTFFDVLVDFEVVLKSSAMGESSFFEMILLQF